MAMCSVFPACPGCSWGSLDLSLGAFKASEFTILLTLRPFRIESDASPRSR